KSTTEALAFLFIYSDRTDSFPDSFKSILHGITPHLAHAIFNTATESSLEYEQEENGHERCHAGEGRKVIQSFPDIVGRGPEMQKVFRMISLVAESNSTVLLLGETGTGKELIARAIHNSSPRKNKPMIKVNCAALPSNLIESELFGFEKGSF